MEIIAKEASMWAPPAPPATDVVTIDLGKEMNFIAWGSVTACIPPTNGVAEMVYVAVMDVDGTPTWAWAGGSGGSEYFHQGSKIGRGRNISFQIRGRNAINSPKPLAGQYYGMASVLAWE